MEQNTAGEVASEGSQEPTEGARNASGTSTITARIQAFRKRHARAEMALFFAGGFLFDVVTLDRIDNWTTLLQQGVYLLVLGGLLLFEQRYRLTGEQPPKGLRWLLRLSEDALHFLLGSLLSSYALFFFKSASGVSAAIFLLVIFGLLVANELPRFRKRGPVVRFGLYSLSLTAYFAYLLPVLFGTMSAVLFVLAALLSVPPFLLFFKLARKWSGEKEIALKQIAAPAGGVQVALLALYFAGSIPPVPLSVEYLGVFHDVRRGEDGQYELLHERPAWRFWQRGDQVFRAREGDKVYVFASVFAPMSFQGRSIYFHWFYDHPEKGWREVSKWEYPKLTGGRAEGYRVFASLSKPLPGDWSVEIRTSDGREVGRIGFTVEPDASFPDAPRDFWVLKK
ncbi:MAG: DUF2914 domain-containing protein [Myxococcaceae bacterium]